MNGSLTIPLGLHHDFASITGTPDERQQRPHSDRIRDCQREVATLQDYLSLLIVALTWEHGEGNLPAAYLKYVHHLDDRLCLLYGELSALAPE